MRQSAQTQTDGGRNVTRVRVKRWELEVDVEATAAAYARRESGDPEKCGCLYCRNFVAARDKAYPPEVRDVFAALGIRPIREAEVWEEAEMRPGVCLYGGFFHVIGRIEAERPVSLRRRMRDWVWRLKLRLEGRRAGVTKWSEQITPTFWVLFDTDVHLVPHCFPRRGLIQLEFSCEVPWVLNEKYEGTKAYIAAPTEGEKPTEK